MATVSSNSPDDPLLRSAPPPIDAKAQRKSGSPRAIGQVPPTLPSLNLDRLARNKMALSTSNSEEPAPQKKLSESGAKRLSPGEAIRLPLPPPPGETPHYPSRSSSSFNEVASHLNAMPEEPEENHPSIAPPPALHSEATGASSLQLPLKYSQEEPIDPVFSHSTTGVTTSYREKEGEIPHPPGLSSGRVKRWSDNIKEGHKEYFREAMKMIHQGKSADEALAIIEGRMGEKERELTSDFKEALKSMERERNKGLERSYSTLPKGRAAELSRFVVSLVTPRGVREPPPGQGIAPLQSAPAWPSYGVKEELLSKEMGDLYERVKGGKSIAFSLKAMKADQSIVERVRKEPALRLQFAKLNGLSALLEKKGEKVEKAEFLEFRRLLDTAEAYLNGRNLSSLDAADSSLKERVEFRYGLLAFCENRLAFEAEDRKPPDMQFRKRVSNENAIRLAKDINALTLRAARDPAIMDPLSGKELMRPEVNSTIEDYFNAQFMAIGSKAELKKFLGLVIDTAYSLGKRGDYNGMLIAYTLLNSAHIQIEGKKSPVKLEGLSPDHRTKFAQLKKFIEGKQRFDDWESVSDNKKITTPTDMILNYLKASVGEIKSDEKGTEIRRIYAAAKATKEIEAARGMKPWSEKEPRDFQGYIAAAGLPEKPDEKADALYEHRLKLQNTS